MSTPHLYPPGGLTLSPPEADKPQGKGPDFHHGGTEDTEMSFRLSGDTDKRKCSVSGIMIQDPAKGHYLLLSFAFGEEAECL